MAVVEYQKEGRIAYITINRPEAMNSLNEKVFQGLQEAMIDFRDNDDLWVAILSGAGDRSFCAGVDIKWFASGPGTSSWVTSVRADTIWKPFIAAINGYCLGAGCELAMTCDIRIASDNAQFGQPEVNIGFMPGMGGTIRMPRFIPRAFAAELLLTGNRINAETALRYGLISRITTEENLMKSAKEIAETIIARGPLGVRATKEAMVRGYSMTLEEGLELERVLANYISTTYDFVEGINAFAEKRPPRYKAK
jgi:E-phenylitaconyl-CoA hydratase